MQPLKANNKLQKLARHSKVQSGAICSLTSKYLTIAVKPKLQLVTFSRKQNQPAVQLLDSLSHTRTKVINAASFVADIRKQTNKVAQHSRKLKIGSHTKFLMRLGAMKNCFEPLQHKQ